MNICLSGWESSGLRCPDMKIELGASNESQIHLIQMPNGTGKTTTLNLIAACLNGCAIEWDQDDVMKYRRLDGTSDAGYFLVRIRTGDEQVSFELNFDFVEQKCSYRTSIAEDGGIRDGWKPPHALKRYFKKEFIEMVVFDGELAARLLDSNYTQAEKAIDALCHLDFFDQMSMAADSIWRNAKLEGALDDGQIQTTRRQINKIKESIDSLSSKINKSKELLEGFYKEKSNLEHDREAELNRHAELKDKYEVAELKVEEANRDRERAMRAMHLTLKNPVSAFPKVQYGLSRFKEGLDRARLPESTSRQFFEEIIKEEACICGAPFNQEMRNHVLSRMSNYLSDETTGVLNLLKEAITKFSDIDIHNNESLEVAIASLKQTNSDYYNADQERAIAKASYDGPGAAEIGKIEQQIGQLMEKIETYERVIENATPQLAIKKNDISKLEDELSEALNSRKIKDQVNIFTSICNEIIEMVRINVKNELLTQCNKDIPEVLLDNPVKIERISGAIYLYNQMAASVGQTLAVGYVFLSRLFSYAAHSFPFIVDSPVGPLDNRVREQVGALIPKLGRQFVAFTISSERVGFVAGLEAASGRSIQFITVHRSFIDSNVANIIDGRDGFFAFHADKEQ